MYFFPKHLPVFDPFTFCGLALFLCLLAGEIGFRFLFIPRITGYIVVGILLGPNFLNLIDKSTLGEMRALTDISLSVILFLIGQKLDFKWLKNDKGLLLTCLSEFSLTIALTSTLMCYLSWNPIQWLLASIIAGTTSPAIILLLTQDLRSDGPVTRRSLIIASFNNFLSISFFALLFPFITPTHHTMTELSLYSIYRLSGSLLLAFVAFKILEILTCYIIEKRKHTQFVLVISVLIFSISFAKYLNLSSFLTLITLGISTRNFDVKHLLLELNLNPITPVLFIPLFFITGCYLEFNGFFEMPTMIIAYVVLRIITKVGSVFLFRKVSNLTNKQAIAISMALMPMSGIAVGLTSAITELNPDLGKQLLVMVSSAVAFWGILGPILSQYVLLRSGETRLYREKG